MEQARHMASMACGRRTVDDGAGAGVAQAQAIGDQIAHRPAITRSDDMMKFTMHFHNKRIASASAS
jgi:hypothetical protein